MLFNYHDVFVSCSAVDEFLARKIQQLLNKAEKRCFMAAHSIPTSAEWRKGVWDALNDVKLCLFLATPYSIKSDWCKFEIGAAMALGKPIFPAMWQVLPAVVRSSRQVIRGFR